MKKILIWVGSLTLFLSACVSNETAKNANTSVQEKIKDISVSVDCSKQIGKIKPLNGVNFGPQISSESSNGGNRELFYALNVHSVRTHDASLQNAGLMIGDTDMMFPLFHADVNDPRNYIFKPTDDYLKVASAKGAKIIFRLGVSIDHSYAKYRTWMPEAKKWAEICCKIIAHYNEGWANGYKMGIEHWEIWNEPECTGRDQQRTMWCGTTEEFNKFYCQVSKIIKSRYPHLKIGGPAHTHAAKHLGYEFLKTAAANGAPVDFYSWHCYGKDLNKMVSQVHQVQKWLDELGFKQTETHLNEWHYFPITWKELAQGKVKLVDKIHTLESGVFATAAMTLWQDAPLTEANFYTYGPRTWGLIDGSEIRETYYPFKAFGEIVKYENRLSTKTPDSVNIPVLAGKDNDGNVAILISLFKTGKNRLSVDLQNCKADLSKAQVLICDNSKKLEAADDVKINGSKIEFPINSDSACVLIKL